MEGENALRSTFSIGDNGHAGLEVEGAHTTAIIEGPGTLIATGSDDAAGIGGRLISGQARGGRPGNIIINGGFIIAVGTLGSAGIGGGNITINGGVVLATHANGMYNPPGIGGGAHCPAGNIRITGGTVYAYGDGSSPGIGGGSSGNGGSITITGGAVIVNRLGIGNNALTPVSISGDSTVIIVGDINLADTANVGNAKVQRGISLPLAVMQAMAANTPYGLTLHDTLLLHDTLPADTTRDTISVHDTLYLDTALLRDTIHLDTVSVYDTVHIDTVSVYDTLHVDTTEVHDTTLIIDPTFIPISVHDTTHFPVSVYDTTLPSAIVVDPTLPPLPRDFIGYRHPYPRPPVDAPTYIFLEDNGSSTDVPIIARTTAIRVSAAGAGILLEGLIAGEASAVYSVDGLLLVRDIAPASGVYIYILRDLAGGRICCGTGVIGSSLSTNN